MKLGRAVPTEERPKGKIRCLYAEPFKSGGWADTKRGERNPDEAMKAAAPCYEVPAWMMGLEGAFNNAMQSERDAYYRSGVQAGKSFVCALAEGRMSVDEFAQKEWR
jgi:hypothetical protein